VRQLTYDFRTWYKIEATGRLGADEGIDISATERFKETLEDDETPSDNDEDAILPTQLRSWIIQCKRERRVGPADIRKIVEEAISNRPTYGLIIAAACDFSARTRASFRQAALEKGTQEFFLWGKAELEDMLFRPANDHLLFAYFGISLQVRKRTLKTELRARLSTKNKLIKVVGDLRGNHFKPVLIRNAADASYPRIKDQTAFRQSPGWRYYYFSGHDYPDHISLQVCRQMAWVSDDASDWDVLEKFDDSWPHHPQIVGLKDDRKKSEEENLYWSYWSSLPDKNRGWYITYALIHYDDILVVDEHGDAYHEGPHLLVDFRGRSSPFRVFRDMIEFGGTYWRQHIYPDEKDRKRFFPKTPPPRVENK
jgi:hypothetical protein